MKYKGKKLEGRNSDVLVLPRGSDRIVLRFQAVDSYDEFDELISIPEPPEILRPGGVKQKNLEDRSYRKALAEYAEQKTSWLVITSLKVTVDLEWEQVDCTKPETWNGWSKELKESGFTETECMRIVQTVSSVNSLDDDMLEQARQSFLAEESQVEKPSSLKGEHLST